MTRALALLICVVASACAYYNGLYNAGGLVRRAESAALDGRDTAAASAWKEAAAKADTVIRRYPRSRWMDDALFLSGTAWALAGECSRGLARLEQWATHQPRKKEHRDRASVARGACLVGRGEYVVALDSLAPHVSAHDGTVARLAAKWAARAAIRAGLGDSAARLARTASSDALDAELAAAALASRNPSLAKRVLAQRAAEWRTISAVHGVLDELARVDHAAADSIVALAQRSRVSRSERAQLWITAGLWREHDGDLKTARDYYGRAMRMTSDTAALTRVATHLGLLDVRSAKTIAEAQSLLQSARGKVRQIAVLADADSALRLAARFVSIRDTTGAPLFLAAEIARDRLGARQLALALFLRTAREYPLSSLAPKALLAASELSPDSANAWRATVRTRYRDTPYAQVLDGRGIPSGSLDGDERLLRQAWARGAARPDSAKVASQPRPP